MILFFFGIYIFLLKRQGNKQEGHFYLRKKAKKFQTTAEEPKHLQEVHSLLIPPNTQNMMIISFLNYYEKKK